MTKIYKLTGKVIKGKNRGRSLGFPTANVRLNKIIPEGVYASYVKIDGDVYNAATFIGSPETFGETDYKAESYILDFEGNIYGKYINISLVKKIRDSKKFSSGKALIAQIKKDVSATREFFGKVC